MYYTQAEFEIGRILDEEKIEISIKLKNSILSIMSEMCNYSEEEHKIRPQIILGTELRSYFKTIYSNNYYVMYQDDVDGTNLPRYFKALALFCDNGWYIVINKVGEKIEYGIFRRYTNIDGTRFEDFYEDNFDERSGSHMIIVKAISSSSISVTRKGKETITISQKFVQDEENIDYEKDFLDLATDIVEKCNESEKVYIKKCLLKLFRNFPLKLHGTIMLVVDEKFEFPENGLAGIVISPQIDFETLFTKYKNIGEYTEAEQVYSLTGALMEMLNTDGITIITNKAKVICYNAFYEGSIPKHIKGGARKRTARGLLNNKDIDNLIGVYFQSQDGEIFYERIDLDE